MLYENILKPIFFRFDPERVHDFMTKSGAFFGRHAVSRAVIRSMYGYRGPDISKTVDGVRFRTPFLLSAGFDYNGELMKILPEIGFGGEEIGSVTARPCLGNSRPRLTRLPRSQSILVNKGLRNDGVDAIIPRIVSARKWQEGNAGNAGPKRLHPPLFVMGVSIARTNDERSSTVQAGIDDYSYSFKRLNESDAGDYYTINISCPNAFCGETFTEPDLLEKLLTALDSIPCKKPVYVKMPINKPIEQFDLLMKVCDSHRVNGLVIGNLNKDYDSLDYREEAPAEYRGGLSGKPCRKLSTALIERARQAYGKRFTIIGVGGVMAPEHAKEKFEAGADLIQLITGMIYKGPGLVNKLCSNCKVASR